MSLLKRRRATFCPLSVQLGLRIPFELNGIRDCKPAQGVHIFAKN
jgi:hypothetical protein